MNDRLSKDNILADMRASKKPLVIFGASTVGQAIQELCVEEGIEVSYYCDNKNYKMNRAYNGLEVINPQRLKDVVGDAAFIIVAADIGDVVNQLATMSYPDWYPGGLLLEGFDYQSSNIDESEAFVQYVMGACRNCHEAYLSKDRIFMRSVDLVLTERCSLKCKDCSNLMQYYEHPVNYELDQMQQSVDNLMSLVDGIQEFRVIGGEPLVNKNFHLVVRQLINEPDIERIVIYTNGTIAPPDYKLELMKSDKVMVLITDYGDLSRNKDKLMAALGKHNISFHIDKAKGWTDCSSIQQHSRSEKQQEQIFTECCAKGLITISNGNLYRCPFSANAAQLHAIPDEPSDYLPLENIHDIDTDQARLLMRTFLNEKKFLKVCDFCSGRPLDATEIPAGLQTRKALKYEHYSAEAEAIRIV
ncbi:radical SAM protein [Gammaproteobacteria bacterium]|nr:radical SAM protein [Gammaproteobacteria bacterium]